MLQGGLSRSKNADLRKVILFSSIGNAFEFFDYAIYGFLIPYMVPLFFPSSDIVASNISAFGVFALGFVAMPLGGIFIGYIGDTRGIKAALSFAILLTSIANLFIFLLPTYHMIGVAAPMILTICRILQGVSMGGEYSGSLIFISENFRYAKGSSHLKSFYTSLPLSAGMLGWFLGAITTSMFTFENNTYYWRVPFLIAGLTGFFALYIRLSSIMETKEMQDYLKSKKVMVYSGGVKAFLCLIGFGCAISAIFYSFCIFANSFLSQIVLMSTSDAISISMFGVFIFMVLLPMWGYIADVFGHKRILLFSGIFLCVSVYPIWYLLVSGKIFSALIAEFIIMNVLAAYNAPITYIMTRFYTVNNRYLRVSLGYNIGMSIGGSVPLICLNLYSKTNNIVSPGLVLTCFVLIGLIAVYMIPKNTIIEKNIWS